MTAATLMANAPARVNVTPLISSRTSSGRKMAVATAIFLPLEARELIKGVTFTRAGAFAINVAAVIYLLLAKRLFGLRGGRAAYDQERHGDSLLEVEAAAAAEPEQRPTTIGPGSARR